MKRSTTAAVVVAAALVGAALAAAAPGPGRPAFSADGPTSPLIFGAQRLPLTFSHAAHLRRAPGMACVDCHDDADSSTSAVDLLIPGESACEMCHPIDRTRPDLVVAGKPPVACTTCHPGFVAGQPVARIEIPTPELKFSHKAHATTACTVCHGDLAAEGVARATRDQLPRMRLCLTCHDDKTAPAACTTCHLSGDDGRVRTTLPGGELEPSGVLWGAAHDLTFRANHKAAAQTTGALCSSCHAQRFCADCHQGVAKPMDFHAGDYLAIHAVEARRGVPDCSACHRLQSFCVGCHERSGVGARAGTEFDPTGDDAGRRFHPEGWAAKNGRGANAHAREFQRNPEQCVACHREDFCLGCHTNDPTNPNRVDPHPVGWRGSARCEALARRAGRMCLRCHLTPAERGCDWGNR
jgi:Cytochrome c7 and related cytochrome c